MGFEPITYWLTANRSTIELFENFYKNIKNYKKLVVYYFRIDKIKKHGTTKGKKTLKWEKNPNKQIVNNINPRKKSII